MARKSARDRRTSTGFERLPASHWTHLRCERPVGAPGPQVDDVLVGPSGVYVVVRRPGGLEIDVAAARSGAAWVSGLLSERYRRRVVPVLCMQDDDPVAERRGDVLVTGITTLEHVVRSSPVVLSTSEVSGLGSRLAGSLGQAPAAPERPRRRPLPVAALLCAASTAAIACVPWADDVWRTLQR